MPIILPQHAMEALQDMATCFDAANEHTPPITHARLLRDYQRGLSFVQEYLNQPPIIATTEDGKALPPNDAAKPAIPFPPTAPPKE